MNKFEFEVIEDVEEDYELEEEITTYFISIEGDNISECFDVDAISDTLKIDYKSIVLNNNGYIDKENCAWFDDSEDAEKAIKEMKEYFKTHKELFNNKGVTRKYRSILEPVTEGFKITDCEYNEHFQILYVKLDTHKTVLKFDYFDNGFDFIGCSHYGERDEDFVDLIFRIGHNMESEINKIAG